ncbi:TetR/AcrR family transcriptional regulator [Hamadaea sp.]|uniref:TetR/AcrR family transcriptional regulator n=1 Tax=Hamadaea sp. TaxID=2024425 RepID=UPI0025BDE212|nr:TetR/AcrR family transcriptional regulator [Hamadaea sp.]
MTEPSPGPTPGKGEQTRRLIVATAIRLFAENGYEKTTMRAIASAAGLSVGNAYYYFSSKEALVQEFYLELQREHSAAVEPILATGGAFGRQLLGVLESGMQVWGPHHQFAGKFIGLAAVPGSPVSPFSPESEESRKISLDIFQRLVDGTTTKMDPALRAELPELLWLLQLGVVVYWVHDESPEQTKTHKIIQRGVPYLEHLVGLSRLKVFRPVTVQGLALLRMLR